MFYIYENWTAADKSIIHLGKCSSCKFGMGTGKNVLGDKNGKWHGPFDTLSETEIYAKNLNREVTRKCKKCF